MLEENSMEQEQGPETLGKAEHKGGSTEKTAGKTGSYLDIFEKVSQEELAEGTAEETEWVKILEEMESTSETLTEGKIVKGTVYSVTEKEVILDVGFKSEGTIPIDEFKNCTEVKRGDIFDVFLEKMENQDGLIVLSKEKADFLRAWSDIKDSYDARSIVTTTVDRRIKGGLVVKLMGVDAFLPGSQIALRQVPNLDEMIGQDLECKIIKLNKRRRNIVVSRRVVLEEEREEKKKSLLSELTVGEEREGVVKNITDFGAFVDLGGIDGLLHLTDLTWGRVSHPSEVVAIGDNLKVKILDFDRERERISLGLKQLEPDPWKALESKYPPGTRLKGRVRNLTNFGAFVEIEDGIDGLVHISDMSWAKRIRHPSEMVKKSDEVEVVVLEIDSDKRRISLGMKQTRENPWTELAKEFTIGTEIHGKITRLLDRGAVVELREDVEGFVPLSHLGIEGLKKPTDYFESGDEIPLKVIKMDPQNKRIVLSVAGFFEGKDSSEIEEFKAKFPSKQTGGEEKKAESEPSSGDEPYDDDYADVVDDIPSPDTAPTEPVSGEDKEEVSEEVSAEEPSDDEQKSEGAAAEEPAPEAATDESETPDTEEDKKE